MTDHIAPLEDDVLAAEYVLGLLDLPERHAFETRLKSDARLAELVMAWEVHFAGLNDQFAEVPAPDLLPRIEARLFGKPAASKQRFWLRILAPVAAVAALLLLVYLPLQTPSPTLMASLTGQAQALVIAASYHDGQLDLTRIAGAAPAAGKSYELWLIAADGIPVSLGLIDGIEAHHKMDTPPTGALLAVTLEPTGGAPEGVPTGPVLVSGTITTS